MPGASGLLRSGARAEPEGRVRPKHPQGGASPPMHELSVCASIAAIVTQHSGPHRVRAVQLEVGRLRQIVPEALTFCWTAVTQDTPLDGAALEVREIPAEITCSACGARSVVEGPVLQCSACGSGLVTVVRGEEFLVTSIEIEKG